MTTIDMVAPTNSHNGSVTTIEQPPTLEERIANLEALVSEMSTTPTEEINAESAFTEERYLVFEEPAELKVPPTWQITNFNLVPATSAVPTRTTRRNATVTSPRSPACQKVK